MWCSPPYPAWLQSPRRPPGRYSSPLTPHREEVSVFPELGGGEGGGGRGRGGGGGLGLTAAGGVGGGLDTGTSTGGGGEGGGGGGDSGTTPPSHLRGNQASKPTLNSACSSKR